MGHNGLHVGGMYWRGHNIPTQGGAGRRGGPGKPGSRRAAVAKPLPAGRPWQAGLPATTKTAGRYTTRWEPNSKTRTMARAVLLVMARMAMAREYFFISGLMARRFMALSRRCVFGFWFRYITRINRPFPKNFSLGSF